MADGYDREVTRDPYVRYTDRRMDAVVLATVGALALAVGQHWAIQSIHVEVVGDWFTVDADAGLVLGNLLAAPGLIMLVYARSVWQDAKVLRAYWRGQGLVHLAFTTVVATTILKALTEVDSDE